MQRFWDIDHEARHVTSLAAAGLVAAATVAFAPQEASAFPLTIDSVSGRTLTVNFNGQNINANVGGFNASAVGAPQPPGDEFLAWCFDLGGRIDTGKAYDFSIGNFLETDAFGRVQSVFNAGYSSVLADISNLDLLAGFQIAIWEAIYDEFAPDLSMGNFSFTQAGTTQANVRAAANTILTNAAAGEYTANWHVIQLATDEIYNNSFGVQNLGTAVIPLPAAAWLLLSAAGGLIVAKRRSAQRAA